MTSFQKALGLGCCLLSLGAAVPAWAIPITVSFTANDLPPGAPESTISGSIDYNAASITSPDVTSFNSINLTIDGDNYTLSEIGTTTVGNEAIIGSLGTYGVGNLARNTYGFYLTFDSQDDLGVAFAFVNGGSDVYQTLSFSQFSITADTPVFEPPSWLVFLTGLAGTGVLLARRRRLS